MKTIKDVLKFKGPVVFTVKPDDTVYYALTILARENIGSLVVVDGAGSVVGIMTERDYARKVFLKGMSSPKALVSEIMSEEVCYVDPGFSVEECLALMSEQRCRHLPVMAAGQLVGLASIGDLVRSLLEEKDFLIKELTRYIQSG